MLWMRKPMEQAQKEDSAVPHDAEEENDSLSFLSREEL